MTQPPHSAEVTVRVPFHDVDPAAVVWHGHYAKYFEVARCALFDAIDYNFEAMLESGYVWPVIDLHVRYVRPATFRQELRVVAKIVEWEFRLRIEYRIFDVRSGERLTRGETTHVAIDSKTREMCYRSPPILFRKLGVPE